MISASEAQAFIDHIGETLPDTSGLMIFADWLEEHGEHEKADWQRESAKLIDAAPMAMVKQIVCTFADYHDYKHKPRLFARLFNEKGFHTHYGFIGLDFLGTQPDSRTYNDFLDYKPYSEYESEWRVVKGNVPPLA